MPRIDIYCRSEFNPPDAHGSACDEKQELVDRMAESLPAIVIARRKKLGLEKGTPEEAVQVRLHRLRRFDRNVPDIGIEFVFTEKPPSKKKRKAIAKALKDLFEEYYGDRDITRSLDIEWGPQHGYIARYEGFELKTTTW
jgi:hypothetical protein